MNHLLLRIFTAIQMRRFLTWQQLVFNSFCKYNFALLKKSNIAIVTPTRMLFRNIQYFYTLYTHAKLHREL